MMDELLELMRENNAMLKKIVAWVDKMESPRYKENEDVKNLAINLIADMAVEKIGNRRNMNDQIFFR